MKVSHPSITTEQIVTLPEILKLLGLQTARLSQSELAALCDRFQSVSYRNRFDGVVIHEHLKLALICLEAVSRDESKTTINKDAKLTEMLQRLHFALHTLHCPIVGASA